MGEHSTWNWEVRTSHHARTIRRPASSLPVVPGPMDSKERRLEGCDLCLPVRGRTCARRARLLGLLRAARGGAQWNIHFVHTPRHPQGPMNLSTLAAFAHARLDDAAARGAWSDWHVPRSGYLARDLR
jgi:hypothetical protein